MPRIEMYTFNVNLVLMICWNLHMPGVEMYKFNVNLVFMVCWNLHMPGVEIYTFNVNLVVMVCWNLGHEIYTWHFYIGEYDINVNRKDGWHCLFVIKHELPVLCDVNAWVAVALSWPAASLTGLHQCMPTHALTVTKHMQPMFNY